MKVILTIGLNPFTAGQRRLSLKPLEDSTEILNCHGRNLNSPLTGVTTQWSQHSNGTFAIINGELISLQIKGAKHSNKYSSLWLNSGSVCIGNISPGNRVILKVFFNQSIAKSNNSKNTYQLSYPFSVEPLVLQFCTEYAEFPLKVVLSSADFLVLISFELSGTY